MTRRRSHDDALSLANGPHLSYAPSLRARRHGPSSVRLGILLLLVWSCLGCETTRPASERFGSSQPAIIVVPGYYGTKLSRASDGAEVWIDAWEALFRSRSLRLPLPGLGFDKALDLRPDGIVNKVNVIPLIYSVEGYGALLEALRKASADREQVVPFTYDWRLDLMDAVRKLGSLVDQLRGQGRCPIAIVAHSMGGLITSYYLRYGTQDLGNAVENWEGAEKVDTVVMAGVPFLGSMTVFRNMQYGVRIGLNRSLLDQKAVASFPASYYLLPAGDADVLLAPASGSVKSMIRKESNWKEYGWGLLKDSSSLQHEIIERRSAYTSSWLREAGRFSNLLLAPPGRSTGTRVPLLYILAKGYPTLAKGVWLDRSPDNTLDRLLFEQEQVETYLPSMDHRLILEDGDGSVTLHSASLPDAYGHALDVTSRERNVDHVDLVREPEIHREIVDFLQVGCTDTSAEVAP